MASTRRDIRGSRAVLTETGSHPSDSTPVVYPAANETIAELHSATSTIVDKAVAAAKGAQAEWAGVSPFERGQILRKAADLVRSRAEEISRLDSLDTGRALAETLNDPLSAAASLDFFAGVIPSYNGESITLGGAKGPWVYTRREPLGVTVGIGAWNYPFEMTGWKSATALAAGNAMVFKPSEYTPLSALILAEIYHEAGVPDGLFNVVQGYGAVGSSIIEHPDVAMVSFTGSVPTGKKVLGLAGSLMKAGTMELGGKSPLVIFDDAPIENAVNGALMANFYSTGQICTNGTRVFVQKSLHDELVARVVERTQKIRIGDPFDPETQMGPLTSRMQLEKVEKYISIGKQENATLACGGGRPEVRGMKDGFWIEPTVFTDVTDNMRIAKEEIFGPVMSILSFEDEDEVIARANDTPYGLAAGVFTNDLNRAHRVAGQFQAGMCWINNFNLVPLEAPFGGYKNSGVGRECSAAALDQFTQIKSVFVETELVESVF